MGPSGGELSPQLLAQHYQTVIKALLEGDVVPFLGAGASLCGRPELAKWQPGQSEFPPSGAELAEHLAAEFDYPLGDVQTRCPACDVNLNLPHIPKDLVHVSQYVLLVRGSGPLYEKLHAIFDRDYPPSLLHAFLAALPAVMKEKGYPVRHQLIVTTNYDDLMERAFQQAGQPYDLVTYSAEGQDSGKFWHRAPNGKIRLIEKPNKYEALSLEERPAILKIHGAVDRPTGEHDSFVITEDHYIDYLTRTDLSNLVPVKLAAKLRRSHFLFLGYGLRDWNLRVILRRIWGEQKLNYKSWAVQREVDNLDQKFWMQRGVEVFRLGLERYTQGLCEELTNKLRPGPVAGS